MPLRFVQPVNAYCYLDAVSALERPRIKRERTMPAAKYEIVSSGTLVAEEEFHIDGGIGMTWRRPVSHLAGRLVMICHQPVGDDHHLSRFAALGPAA